MDDLERVVEGLEQARDQDRGVDLQREVRLDRRQDLARQDNHRRCAVAHLVILGLGKLDDGLGGRVGHVQLAEDGVPV